jgi:hypothetical protein
VSSKILNSNIVGNLMLHHYTVGENPSLEIVKLLFQLGTDTTNKFMGEFAHRAPPVVIKMIL